MDSNEYKYLKYKIKYLKKHISMVGGELKCKCQIIRKSTISGSQDPVEETKNDEETCTCSIYDDNKKDKNKGKRVKLQKKSKNINDQITILQAALAKIIEEEEKLDK